MNSLSKLLLKRRRKRFKKWMNTESIWKIEVREFIIILPLFKTTL